MHSTDGNFVAHEEQQQVSIDMDMDMDETATFLDIQPVLSSTEK